MARPTTRTDARPDAAAPPTTPAPSGAVRAARASAHRVADVPTQRGRGRRPAPAPLPLGSLVTARDRSASCPQCAGTAITRLAMTLGDGTPVTFVSCHGCEARGWFAGDRSAIPLDAVLGSTALG